MSVSSVAGEDVYFGNHVALSFVEIANGYATFHETVLGDEVFIGPASHLFCGARLESGASVGALAMVFPMEKIATGVTRMALDVRVASHMEPMLAGKHFWLLYSVFIGVYRVVVEGVTIGLICYMAIYPFSKLDNMNVVRVFPLSILFFGLMYVTYVVMVLAHAILLKWVLMGRTESGIAYPIRGYYHMCWVLTWHYCQHLRNVLRSFTDMDEVMSTLQRWMGAKVGKWVLHTNGPAFYPEMDMLQLGDGVAIGVIYYGHDFHKMRMEFKPVTIGAGCILPPSTTQLIPGVRLPHLCSCSPATNLVIPGCIREPRTTFHGNPARPCSYGPHGEYLKEGDGVIIHQHFTAQGDESHPATIGQVVCSSEGDGYSLTL
ncbi:hypothetical protein CYMTET_53925 [Cymbomonas tetramitiformis]|uniref:Uncharacterized protein n=1 Tax=Cymbomonas tetramitiformis TaxID=36881 RepID=A0AAE0BFY1_9CHLO|nr:hypothetical protein CYMTET_53925 [Cymbomonas tetramitiformis]